MNTRHVFYAVACTVVTACAAPHAETGGDQVRQTPMASTFSFSARAEHHGHDSDDPKAEAARLDTLKQHLRTNQMCPKGYVLTSRRVIVQMGEKDQIIYVGRCTD